MAERSEKPGSWWLTLPGLLTGTAAVVTAVTGLLLGLHQVGWLGSTGESAATATTPAAVSTPTPSRAAGTATPETGAQAGERFDVNIPLNRSYKSGTVAYSVTAATAEPDVDDQLRLSFTIHAANSGRYDLGFWDGSFRVVAGVESYPPTPGLDKVVPGDSTASGQIEFVIPAAVTQAKLVLRFVEGDRTVPFTVTAPNE